MQVQEKTGVKSPNRFWREALRLIGSLLAVGLLVFSSYVCYLFIMAITEVWAVPWDTTAIRPPIGHWQRSINDFFEWGIGAYLPTATFLLISLWLYIRTLIRTQAVRTASFVFGTTNLIALPAVFAIGILVRDFLVRTPAYLTPDDWSYWGDFTRQWPLIVVPLVLLAGLFLAQPYLVRHLTGTRRDLAS